MQALASLLRERLPDAVRLRESVPAQELTTFGLGAAVPLLIEPLSIAAFVETVKLCREEGQSWKVLGAGSNLLLPDSELSSVVLRFGREWSGFFVLSENEAIDFDFSVPLTRPPALPQQADRELAVLALAGAPLIGLSRRLTAAGLSGLEFAAGIPGTIGGGVRMNAGAHRHQLSEIVTRCLVIDQAGELVERSRAQLEFSYRHSALKPEEVVLAAALQLQPKPIECCQAERSQCLEYRKRTQPLHLPSAGSVFRNPSPEQISSSTILLEIDPPPAAAVLLERIGFKGKAKGGVRFSELHANWLVVAGPEAKSSAARALIDEAIEAVWNEFGIRLRPEIDCW